MCADEPAGRPSMSEPAKSSARVVFVDLLRLVVGRGLTLVGIGIATGTVGALLANRWIRTLLFGVEPGDPFVYAATGLLFVTVGLLACLVPARSAMRVDPAVSLRAE